MATKLDIANQALLRIGNRVLQSLDEDSIDASYVNTLFDPAIREVLREGVWSCASKRAALVQNIDAPLFQYKYAYALPADFIRLVNVYNANGEFMNDQYWKIEGNNLITDMSQVNLLYVYIPQDLNVLDDLCSQCVVTKLAMKLAAPKTENETLVKGLITEYEQLMVQKAKSIDAIENFEESKFGEMNWFDSRYYTL